jgi:hypothetical protein
MIFPLSILIWYFLVFSWYLKTIIIERIFEKPTRFRSRRNLLDNVIYLGLILAFHHFLYIISTYNFRLFEFTIICLVSIFLFTWDDPKPFFMLSRKIWSNKVKCKKFHYFPTRLLLEKIKIARAIYLIIQRAKNFFYFFLIWF